MSAIAMWKTRILFWFQAFRCQRESRWKGLQPKRRILVDGKAGALLLQIFSENQLGPIFFEFIQRKGDEGFGEGNFKALFESVERDQIERGVIKAGTAA